MPASSVIPDDVKRFVLTSIPSVPYLEAVLWARGHRDAVFGVAEVARALYLAEPDVAPLLEALVGAGILQQAGSAERPSYRYEPREAGLRETIDALAEAYSAHLVEIARLIHDATHRNAHRFADAFRLRRKS